MVGTSFYRLKAERCTQFARSEVDPSRRLELETESRLWLQIAVTEDDRAGVLQKAKDLLTLPIKRRAGADDSAFPQALASSCAAPTPEASFLMAKHPEIVVKLSGPGNDFSILDEVSKALRGAGVSVEEIDTLFDLALSAAERDLLHICARWVTLVPD
jgi:hypothetical protein